ncbi:leucine-rich repeat domain-containing protein [Neochlamydia sp. S13]|uniref:leucine-rich repeat domain-containing protein n=1 Tax=Neochlamydia sp. S13 TaxID=1353976 RepID=UPI00069433E1|nr:leucine-rich repeat domain-containing protein [Neochlamydia sp. S13]BBI16314.1 Leucine-rich repeat LRR protein [Neochlamydia sp. S13]
MNPCSSITIEHLPNEILVPILKVCAAPSLSSVCTRWRHLLATEVMPSLYKQISKMHFPAGDVNKQTFVLDRIYKLEEELSKAAKVNAIFRQTFTQATSISPLEFKGSIEEKRDFTLTNYHSYLVNINRLLIWKELRGGEEYLGKEEIKNLPLKERGRLFKEWIESYSKDIRKLNVARIGLTLLPSEIGQLSQLQTLELSNNQLTTLPAEIRQLSQLQCLYLENNYLTTLPAEIGQLSQLQRLHLENNQLTNLPAEIRQLSQLQRLYLNKNQLTTLPAEIWQLSQLQRLKLDNNQLTTLPTKIGQLTRLEKLKLSSNQLTSLPAEIGHLPNELNLYLDRNPLESIPNKIKQRFRL